MKKKTPFQVHASMAVFWYLDDIVLDWIGQTGPGLGAKVTETRGKVKFLIIKSILNVKLYFELNIHHVYIVY